MWGSPTLATDKRRAFIMHCNWVMKSEQKKLRLRRDNLWFLDENDETCRAGFDPLAEGCHRRCVPAKVCAVGQPCQYHSCRSLTQRALTDLARSVRSSAALPEDRWHPMAFQRACSPAQRAAAGPTETIGGFTLPGMAAAALDRAAEQLVRGAAAADVFADPQITDIRSRHTFRDVHNLSLVRAQRAMEAGDQSGARSRSRAMSRAGWKSRAHHAS